MRFWIVPSVAVLSACGVSEGTVVRSHDGGTVSQDASADSGELADAVAEDGGSRLLPGMSFQIQLTGTIDPSFDAQVYDIDLFDAPTGVIDALRAAGRLVLCFVSVGTHEPWRPDADLFPAEALGEPLVNYPDERWLDIRDPEVRTLMSRRFDLARQKGCDGVQASSADGYLATTGFAITSADQLEFNRYLAREAHARGLMAGVSNDFEQLDTLVAELDFALVIECYDDGTCPLASPLIQAGKPVFHVEHASSDRLGELCAAGETLGFSTILKPRGFGPDRTACP